MGIIRSTLGRRAALRLLTLLTLLAASHVLGAPAAAQGGPDLTVSIHLTGGVVTSASGLSVTLGNVTTRNNGAAQAAASTTRFHLVPAVGPAISIGERAIGVLDPGAEDVGGPLVLDLPVTGGTFQIVAEADADRLVAEDNEGNNFSAPSRSLVIGPDLVVFLSTKDNGKTVRARTRNRATNSTGVDPSTTWFFLSADLNFDGGDIFVGSREVPALGPRSVATTVPSEDVGDTPLNLPPDLSAGTYYVIGWTDGPRLHAESDETNNVSFSEPVTFLSDLAIAATTLPRKALAGDTLPASVTTTNRGAAQALASTTGIYLSRDAALDAGDVLVGTQVVGTLDVGASSVDAPTIVIPPGTAPGCYFLIARGDAGGVVAESDENNNTARVRAFQVRPPDGVKLLCADNDFNGDRTSDILWRHSEGDVGVWLLNESGAGVVSRAPLNWIIDGVGDFNGDGKADILWHDSTSGAVGLWVMDGVNLVRALVVETPAPDWAIAGVGDFDGDGRKDVLWRHSPSGTVGVWLMDGVSLGSAAVVGSPPPLDWIVAGVGDFDGDGNEDILWQDPDSGAVEIWFMDGSNLRNTAVVASRPLDWAIAGVGDFDANDRADILWRHMGSGEVEIWLMDGSNFTLTSLGAVSLDWIIQKTGDYNHDGKADILWRDVTGLVGIWFMNGTSMQSAVALETVGPEWTIQ